MLETRLINYDDNAGILSYLNANGEWKQVSKQDFNAATQKLIDAFFKDIENLRPIEQRQIEQLTEQSQKLSEEKEQLSSENKAVKEENVVVKEQNKTLEQTNESLKIAVSKLFSSAEIQANIDSYPEYEVGKAYAPGDTFRYQGKLYITVQAHTSQADWLPDAVPALYTPIEVIGKATDGSDIKEFKQPTGAHDAYKKGDKVRYNGKVYESLIDNNAYSPDAYPQGWKEVN